jgi:hypothetical protein
MIKTVKMITGWAKSYLLDVVYKNAWLFIHQLEEIYLFSSSSLSFNILVFAALWKLHFYYASTTICSLFFPFSFSKT